MRSVMHPLRGAVRALRQAGRRPRGGFSLIEILIAVVVLALGLLGVGAVFPVVIRSQRQAQDVVHGQIASRSATSYILGRRYMIDSLRMLAYDFDSDDKTDDPPEYDASPWYVWGDGSGKEYGTVTPTTGDLMLPHPAPPTSTNAFIYMPVSERLFPAPFTPGIDPQYVWDLAVRRKKSGGFQVLVFTRRIDPLVGAPDGLTLSNVLTGRYATSSQRRLPTTVDATGRPVGSGIGAYSRIRTLELDRSGWDDPEVQDPSLVAVKNMNDNGPGWNDSDVFRYAEAVGQKLVDNMGGIYTVVGTVEGTDSASDSKNMVWLRLSPPLAQEAWAQKTAGAEVSFAMTPQVPAYVSVIDVGGE